MVIPRQPIVQTRRDGIAYLAFAACAAIGIGYGSSIFTEGMLGHGFLQSSGDRVLDAIGLSAGLVLLGLIGVRCRRVFTELRALGKDVGD